MAYRYHRGINECYAGTSSESSQIKEEHELEEHATFLLHKAVVRHGFRKIRLHCTLNEEQVVVLEIAECTEIGRARMPSSACSPCKSLPQFGIK